MHKSCGDKFKSVIMGYCNRNIFCHIYLKPYYLFQRTLLFTIDLDLKKDYNYPTVYSMIQKTLYIDNTNQEDKNTTFSKILERLQSERPADWSD